jgi:soluble lytic murein transglycosylase-like protein
MLSRFLAAVAAAAVALSISLPASASPYDTIIKRYSKTYGVPFGLARAVVKVESGFRANARGKAGEIGLMQVKLSTARGLGYTGSAKGLYNPDTNIRYGMISQWRTRSAASPHAAPSCATMPGMAPSA